MSNKYFLHFNTRIKATDRNKLTRENYCIPTYKPNYSTRKYLKYVKEFYENNHTYPPFCQEIYCDFPNDIFSDTEHYSEQWVEDHYRDCMENFDLNMQFFSSLDERDFQKHLLRFQKRNKLKEVSDLNVVSGVEGVYVLVLDEYKQIYIGKSNDIKKRILSHWSSKKDFERLIYGSVEESVLSIDSFGALDTTRIFYKPASWCDLDKMEEKLVDSFEKYYLLNRVSGGLNGEECKLVRDLKFLASMQKRKLK